MNNQNYEIANPAEEKNTIRQEAIKIRSKIDDRLSASKKICDNFFNHFNVKDMNDNFIVSAYWAKNDELDCFAVIEKLLYLGIDVALPITPRSKYSALSFARYNENVKLQKGRFGIMEPIADNTQTIDPILPDMILVPMLAFDRIGNRIGYGGGFFDATIKFLREKKQVISVGMAYDEQLCLFKLPTEDHDQKLDMIITPSQIYKGKG